MKIEATLRYFRLIIGRLKGLKVKGSIYRAINSHHKEMALWPLSHLSVNPNHYNQAVGWGEETRG